MAKQWLSNQATLNAIGYLFSYLVSRSPCTLLVVPKWLWMGFWSRIYFFYITTIIKDCYLGHPSHKRISGQRKMSFIFDHCSLHIYIYSLKHSVYIRVFPMPRNYPYFPWREFQQNWCFVSYVTEKRTNKQTNHIKYTNIQGKQFYVL